ncbi:class I SAM-dependent DNA methyltransferase [Nostoc sp. CMAA1605]|uniref:class I SAM-dependent DNA methyltransferase n=1 Tax=Nostoc sp. CMAA1605 TaxID=2055159 RepID=UPI001F2755DA|nr:class I SAM-dependent methyltransferase [Nostoc sp. CMAA1605]MCF4968126.1 class I SAM-dependent methyltransferase [Nostoc sp. CMAA1605]
MYLASPIIEDNALNLYNNWAFAYPQDNSSELWLEFLGKHILEYLPENARILDVGCGQGQLVNKLIAKGYQVTGVDLSDEMLRYARKNAPSGEFIQSDIRSFEMPPTFHAVVSSSTVFNYMLSIEDLTKAFQKVYDSLLPNGWFGFDLSEGELVREDNNLVEECSGDFGDDYTWLQRSIYDPKSKLWQSHYVTFQLLDGSWHRKDVNCTAKAYSRTEVQSVLEKVGFTKVLVNDVTQDAEISGLADSRIIYVFRKSIF